MSRPPKQIIVDTEETIYTDNPTYDPYAPYREEDRAPLPQVRASQALSSVNGDETGSNHSKSRGGDTTVDGGEWGWGKNHTYEDTYNYRKSRDRSKINDNSDNESSRSSAAADERSKLIVSGANNYRQDGNNEPETDGEGQYMASASLERSFCASLAHCVCHPFQGIVDWCTDFADTLAFSRKRIAALKGRDIFFFFAFLFVLTGTQMMAVFGFNFWLHSFEMGNPTYATIVIPSCIYAVVNFLMIPLFKYNQQPGESLLFWTDSFESIVMLIVIGAADSVAGMTSTYAVPHIPVILQTSISASSAIWVYALHRWLYKKTAQPMSLLLLLCFAFLLASVACAVAPIYIEGKTGTTIEGKWIGCFAIAMLAPAICNVVQGRFLGKYADRKDVPPETAKFVSLTGDFWVQALLSFVYFPLDFTPGFGPSPDAEHAWEMAKDATKCIAECDNYNWIYMTLYCAGFWCGRILRTIMNFYSPTMGTFVMQLMGPIKAFAMVIFPHLNLKGKATDVKYTAGTFAALLVATMFYLLAGEQQALRRERRRLLKTEGGVDGDNNNDATANKKEATDSYADDYRAGIATGVPTQPEDVYRTVGVGGGGAYL